MELLADSYNSDDSSDDAPPAPKRPSTVQHSPSSGKAITDPSKHRPYKEVYATSCYTTMPTTETTTQPYYTTQVSTTSMSPFMKYPQPVSGAYVSKRKTRYTPSSSDTNKTVIAAAPADFKSPELDEYLNCPGPVSSEGVVEGVATSVHNRVSSGVQYKWVGHGDRPVESIDWHPSHPDLLLSAGFDGVCKLWNVSKQSHCLCSHTPHDNQAISNSSWLSPSSVLSGGYDCAVVLTDYIAMKNVAKFVHESHVTALKPHPTDSNLFVSGDTSKHIQLWDIRVGTSVTKYIGAGGRVLDVEFINNGVEVVASCDIVRKNAGSKMLLVWETSTAIIRSNQIYNEPYTCPCLRASPTEGTFLAQSNADYIIIFSCNKPYKLNKYKRFEGHHVNGYRTLFDISPDGSLVCSGSANGDLYFYHYYSTKIIKTIRVQGRASPVIAVKWHPMNSSKLACSSWNGLLSICHQI